MYVLRFIGNELLCSYKYGTQIIQKIINQVNQYYEMKKVIITYLARFSVRLFVGIRTKTIIPININMWQTQRALECVLPLGVVERTIYEIIFVELGLTTTLFISWLCLYNIWRNPIKYSKYLISVYCTKC
jgi:hypothetical protein